VAAEAIFLNRVLIFADDLTGAADCAAAFLGRARRVSVALGAGAMPRAEVLAVDLDTRSRTERDARRIVGRAFSSAAARRAGILFKKIDSTLRGHVAAELSAARRALGRRCPVILAPAFPAQGRLVKNGRVYVNGVALRGAPRMQMLDAQSDGDLDRIARSGLAMRPRPLFVGSAGMAHALARCLRAARGAPREPVRRRPVVTVVGSASPVSVRQARRLSDSAPAARHHVLLQLEWTRQPTARDRPVARRLARIVASNAAHAHYVLTGGETARAVLDALGVRAYRLLGEVEPGVPFGLAPDGTLVCTKAGAFGHRDTLVNCVGRLKREMKRA